jgi:hypothetical protein
MRNSLRGRLATLTAAAAIAVGAAADAGAPAIAQTAAVTAPRWTVFFTSGKGPSDLTDITSAGQRSAWAAGTDNAGLYLMHWNGAAWRQQAVPGSKDCIPYSVQATSISAVWVMCESAAGPSHTAFVLDHGSWQSVSLPDTDTATASGVVDVWGYGADGYCTGGSAPTCIGQVWHWSAGTLTSFAVPGTVVAMTAAGGHAWLLTQTAASRLAVYESESAGLAEVAPLSATIGPFPQIAASPTGRAWVLDRGLGKRGRAAVYAWDGGHWSRHLVPRAVFFGSWGFTYDGRAGVWLGPYTHWTGTRWVVTSPSGPSAQYELMFIAPIPHTSSAWAVGFNSARPGTRRYRGLIALLGRIPR